MQQTHGEIRNALANRPADDAIVHIAAADLRALLEERDQLAVEQAVVLRTHAATFQALEDAQALLRSFRGG